TYVDPGGMAFDLAPADVEIDVTAHWLSPHSGATYPMAWNLRISRQLLSLTVLPVMEDQELDTRKTTRITYWEGQVEVSGSRAGEPVKGRGYTELTGYARKRDGTLP